jgi:ABC-type taurine transport system ATPase subunit
LSEAAVTGLLRLADLDASFANKSIIGLSVGQAQRVALARTLANEPEVRFCDYAFVLFNCLALEYGLFIPAKKFFQTLVDADLHASNRFFFLMSQQVH